MTTSSSEAADRPIRGKNQQNPGKAKAADRPAEQIKADQTAMNAAGPGQRERAQGRTAGSPGPASTGWGRYLVAARPAAAMPAGVAAVAPEVLSRLLSEDEQVVVLTEIGRPDQFGRHGQFDQPDQFGRHRQNGQAGQPGQFGQSGQSGQPGQLGQPGQFGHLGHLGQPGQPGHLGQHDAPPQPQPQPVPGPARPQPCPAVTVVAMPPAHAAQLCANPALICEPDAPLVCTAANPLSAIVPAADPALAVPLTAPETVVVHVRDGEGNPVPGAHVWALGTAFPAHARTDTSGTAIVVLVADTPETLRGIYVRPATGFWPARLPATTALGFDRDDVTVTVRALDEPHAAADTAAPAGWGPAALGMGSLPPELRGRGVKIAVLDSGIDASHPMLKEAVRGGADFTGGDSDPESWTLDRTGRGTACAGVIAAADTGAGQGGMATEAELYGLRLFPRGRVGALLAALDWCVENGMDVAQINVACPPSALVEWKLADARAAGLVVTAPAGDTGTITAYPAAVPGVIAVGALAHPDTDPGTHLDLPTARPAWPGPYTPAFTPIGADLAAPGTAVITTAPGGEHTVADGTAIATSHITALAALLIAHHRQLRPDTAEATAAGPGAHRENRRAPGRAEQVAALLRSASRVPVGCDPDRAGAGLPDAGAALAVPIGHAAGRPML